MSMSNIAILATCLASLGQPMKVFNCDGKCVNIDINCDDINGCENDSSLLDLDKNTTRYSRPSYLGQGAF